jgi:hypothetical protein
MANSSLHADDTYVLKVLDFLIGLFLFVREDCFGLYLIELFRLPD